MGDLGPEVSEPNDNVDEVNLINPIKEQFLTTKQVAELFEVTAETVRNWLTSGRLEGMNLNGYWRVPKSNVVAFANKMYQTQPDDKRVIL